MIDQIDSSTRQSETDEAPESAWRRMANRIWGYDFFISYDWETGGPYAVNLAEQLRDKHFDCFLDRAEFAMGDDWKKQAKVALRNTKRLVVVATPEAVKDSPAVEHEVQVFVGRSNRVIPIVFGERFTDEERSQLPVLKLVPSQTLEIVEKITHRDKRPSDSVIEELIRTHRILRRRSVRAIAVLIIFFLVASAAVIAIDGWVRAESERQEAVKAKEQEERQKLVAQSAELVNKANLLRQTQGPMLEQSIASARDAVAKAQRAGEPSENAERALRQALELMPQRIGEPWLPFGTPVPLRLLVTGQRLVVFPEAENGDDDRFALVITFNGDTEQWVVDREFVAANDGELLADEYGRPIESPDNPQWLLTRHDSKIVIWDVVKGTRYKTLQIDHTPRQDDGIELLAINNSANHALLRTGNKLAVLNLKESDREYTTLPIPYTHANYYAISQSGRLLAWARQNEFVVVLIRDSEDDTRFQNLDQPTEVLRYPITQGGGHPESLKFIDGPSHAPDPAVAVTWSGNQVRGSGPSRRRDAPNHQAGIWFLDLDPGDPTHGQPKDNRPDIRHIREDTFNLVFGEESMAVLDKDNPVQWFELESQFSFTLGGTAGPGKHAQLDFNAILITHMDGTARLWSLKTRDESLRFTTSGGDISNALFLRNAASKKRGVVVTLDSQHRLQAWTSERKKEAARNEKGNG
jgi:hypothetical protein